MNEETLMIFCSLPEKDKEAVNKQITELLQEQKAGTKEAPRR